MKNYIIGEGMSLNPWMHRRNSSHNFKFILMDSYLGSFPKYHHSPNMALI